MVNTNGDKAFIVQMENKISSLKKEGDESEVDVLLLTAIVSLYQRTVGIEKKMNDQVRFPSLLYLFVRRPLEAVPYGLAVLIVMSSLFIEDIRQAALSVWGLPSDLFTILSQGRGTAAIAILVIVGVVNGSKRK